MHPLQIWINHQMITSNKFAKMIGVAPMTVYRILHGHDASIRVISLIERATGDKVTRYDLHKRAHLYWPKEGPKFDLEPASTPMIHETPKPSPKPSKRATAYPLHEDFCLTQDMLRWAEDKGYSPYYMQRQLDSMRDWALSKNEKKADWNAALRIWATRNYNRFNQQQRDADEITF